jgi:hypothetical protein
MGAPSASVTDAPCVHPGLKNESGPFPQERYFGVQSKGPVGLARPLLLFSDIDLHKPRFVTARSPATSLPRWSAPQHDVRRLRRAPCTRRATAPLPAIGYRGWGGFCLADGDGVDIPHPATGRTCSACIHTVTARPRGST